MEAFARRFRCVCLDMDGTLCTNARHPDGHDRVTPRTAAALRHYKASGGTVVVATFRQTGTDKAVALAAVVEMLGITAADCCAFGDGDNDLGMFRWAGWSVCPSNAMPEAEEVAATISTLSNNDDFIAEFFTRPTPSNTDESKVLPYTLPDPLRCDDGSRL